LNYYASTIRVFCQSPSNKVSCSFRTVQDKVKTIAGSPATLDDGATANVQLVVKNTSSASAVRPTLLRSLGGANFLAVFLPMFLLVANRRSRSALARFSVIALATLISCGGGNGGGGTGGGGGGGNPETVKLSVGGQAANTNTDSNNQKTLPTIVITLD
jgi:hypothetical protein